MQFWSVAVAILLLATSNVRAGVLARFKMNDKLGTLDIELFEHDKPTTVSNFVSYINSGAWRDTMIERWEPGFVIQGGTLHMNHSTNLMTDWNVNPDILSGPSIPFERDVNHFYSNTAGTIAMARQGTNINSGSTTWFVNLANNTGLDTQDGGYTVFGRVVRGTNYLQRFLRPSGSTNVYQVSGSTVPVYTEDTTNIFWLNVELSLLSVQISSVQGGNAITWNSVEGVPNIIESSSTVPPTWSTLQSVAGTGSSMTITNDPGRATVRYYRVRIDYAQ